MNKYPEIRFEELLLLGLCRLSFTPEQTEKLRALALSHCNWDYFVRLANDHGIAALVHHNISTLGLADLIPPDHVSGLRNAHLISISRNAFHLSAAEELLALLRKEKIKAVVLKGLALELTVYGNSGLRQMTDVDLLIERNDYIRARKLLMESGYDSGEVKSGFHKPIIEWTGKHLPSLMKNGLSIDLHLELFPGRKNNLTREILDTAVPLTLVNEQSFSPQPSLFFLYLVRHLHRHEMNNESQLRLYTDLVVLLGKHYDEIVNYDLLERASRAGISKILAWKLELLRDLWGIRFPEWTDDFIDKWFNPGSINKFVFFLSSPKDNKPDQPGRVYRSTVGEIPGLHRKLMFILGDIFPTISFMKTRYGVSSAFKALIRYPLRLGKLLWLIRR